MVIGYPKENMLLVQMIRERDDKLRQAEEIMALDQRLLDADDELVEKQKLQIQKLENTLKVIKEVIEAYERQKSKQDAYIKTLESVISTHEKELYEYEELSKLQRERNCQLEELLKKKDEGESCDESTSAEQ